MPSGKVATVLSKHLVPELEVILDSRVNIIYALTHVHTFSGNRPISTIGKEEISRPKSTSTWACPKRAASGPFYLDVVAKAIPH